MKRCGRVDFAIFFMTYATRCKAVYLGGLGADPLSRPLGQQTGGLLDSFLSVAGHGGRPSQQQSPQGRMEALLRGQSLML